MAADWLIAEMNEKTSRKPVAKYWPVIDSRRRMRIGHSFDSRAPTWHRPFVVSNRRRSNATTTDELRISPMVPRRFDGSAAVIDVGGQLVSRLRILGPPTAQKADQILRNFARNGHRNNSSDRHPGSHQNRSLTVGVDPLDQFRQTGFANVMPRTTSSTSVAEGRTGKVDSGDCRTFAFEDH
jgi:hypothetical protein